MKKRKYISKTVRFEVFKRDSFKCQYCGAQAPEVVLHVDHVIPVSKGGDNEILNLITSCSDCNLGKSNKLISDGSALKVQKKQLDELNARREQVEMMAEWRKGLLSIENKCAHVIASAIDSHMVGRSVSDDGMNAIRKWVKRFDLGLILECVDVSAAQYLKEEDGATTKESAGKFFDMIPRIAHVKKNTSDGDVSHKLYYMRGILRNRFNYIHERDSINLLKTAADLGESIESLQELCKTAKNWTSFKTSIQSIIDDLSGMEV